jgi:hypothetical protein
MSKSRRRGRVDYVEIARKNQEEGRRRQAAITAKQQATRRLNAKLRKPAPKDYKAAAFYVPNGLDLKSLLGPLEWPGAYLLNLIHVRSAWWREDRDGFVRLKAEYVQKVIPRKHWPRVRDTLVGAGVLDWNREFDKGRSQGYRIKADYRHTHREVCPNAALNRRIARLYATEQRYSVPVHRWLESKLALLEVDVERADTIIDRLKPRKKGFDVAEHRQRVRDQVVMLANRDYQATVCRYGRFHSPVTRLPRQLRSCLSVAGKPLVNIDLANSQPLLFGIVVRQWLTSTGSAGRKARQRLRDMSFTNSNPYTGTHKRLAAVAPSSLPTPTSISSTTTSHPIPKPNPYYGRKLPVTTCKNKDLREGGSGAPPYPPTTPNTCAAAKRASSTSRF